jgi:hypothetical protein
LGAKTDFRVGSEARGAALSVGLGLGVETDLGVGLDARGVVLGVGLGFGAVIVGSGAR